MSTGLQYPENEYGSDLQRIDEELGDRKIAGLVSEEFRDVKLRWSTGLEEDEVMEAVDEALGVEQEALGARLENDALLNYHEGVVQYSSADGDISVLPEVIEASLEHEPYVEGLVQGLVDEYGWLNHQQETF